MLLNPARDDTTRVFEKIEDVTALIGGRFNWRPGIGWYPKWSFNCVDAYLEETPNFYRRSRLIDFEIQVDREDGGQQPEGILNPSVMFSLDAIISKRPEEIADQVLKIMTTDYTEFDEAKEVARKLELESVNQAARAGFVAAGLPIPEHLLTDQEKEL